jgi:hypothetical protein
MGLVPIGASIAVVPEAVVDHSHAEHSAYVQAHGVREVGTVLMVTNTVVDSGSGAQVAQVVVWLQAPVDGQDVTMAHVPTPVYSPDGSTVTVLVDPADPGYAEYPGMRYSGPRAWLIQAIAGLFMAAFGILYLIFFLPRVLPRRRE